MSKLLKYITFLILINNLIAHDCLILEQGNYGGCDFPLGYTWNGDGCDYTISGCDYYNTATEQDDSASFYLTYEECVSNCFQHTGVLGDLNEDLEIDILDVVFIVDSVFEY